MENNILDLPLKKEWYEMIESGVKTEEYREIKPYWCNRLLYSCTLGIKEYWTPMLDKIKNYVNENGEKISSINLHNLLIKDYGTRCFTHIRFRFGYTNRTMLFKLESISVGKGNKDWGAPDDDVFILKLGDRIWNEI